MKEMETSPKPETSLERWRSATAEVLRPVPYTPINSPAPAPAPAVNEKPNFPKALWRGKWWILLMALVGAAYGGYQVVMQIPLYGAATTLEMMTPNGSFLGQGRFDPQSQDSYIVTTANIQTQLRIVLGPAIARRARERVLLESPPLPIPSTGFLTKLRTRLHLFPQDNMEFLRASINTAARTTGARQAGTTKLIEVSCLSISADTAANFLNALASEYVAQSQQVRTQTATRTLQFLSTQLEDAKARVDETDAKLDSFLKNSGRAFVLDKSTLDVSKLAALQQGLSDSQSDRIAKQARWDLAKSSPVDSLPEILDDGTLKTHKSEIATLRRERALLTATLTASHPRVIKIDAQLAELERALQNEKSNLVRRIQNEYEAALKREQLMTDTYNKQTQTVANETTKSSEYANLKRSSETERTLYNALLQQFSEASVTAAVPSSSVRVIDAATPSYVPVKPQPTRDIATNTFGGIALAVVILLGLEFISVKKRSQVFAAPGASRQVLNVPELGILPAFEGAVTPARRSLFGARNGVGAGEDDSTLSPISWAKEPFLAESIRHAFASILARNNDGAHRLYVITSASASEGKTTLIGNLGVAMAEAGRRVLMVDADLRAPRLSSVFRMEVKGGLTEIYTSTTPIADLALDGYIKRTETPNLFLLSSGEADQKTAGELPFSRRVRELFARLRTEYDYILIDTPPSIQFSDARLLGQISDGVILVIRSGVSSRENVGLTVRRLEDDGVPIVGSILNHWQATKDNSSYGGYMYGYRGPYNGTPKA